MNLPNLTLVLGGAASGKSSWAERLVVAAGRPKVYIATAEAWDVEMQTKILHHRAMRGPSWQTIEAPRDLATALGGISPMATILVDCATMWLTNVMMAEDDLTVAEDSLSAALVSCPAPVVVVSNELGLGLVPETPLGRRFRDAQGRLNQRLAAQADLVVFVAAGLPLALKGALP